MTGDHQMFVLSWYYVYGIGTLVYAIGSIIGIRGGVIDLANRNDRVIYLGVTACLALFAGVHALFQFVLPFTGDGG